MSGSDVETIRDTETLEIQRPLEILRTASVYLLARRNCAQTP